MITRLTKIMMNKNNSLMNNHKEVSLIINKNNKKKMKIKMKVKNRIKRKRKIVNNLKILLLLKM